MTELCNNNVCTEEQCCTTVDSEINNNIVNVEASELGPISNLEEELKPKFMKDSGDKGSRCVENLDCKSNYCKNGRCVEMEDLDPHKYSPEECKKRRSCEINVPCEDNIHCLSGYCGNELLCAEPEPEETPGEVDCVDDNSTLANILIEEGFESMTCSEAFQEYGEETLCVTSGLEEVCAQSCNYQGCAGTSSPTDTRRETPPETAPAESPPPTETRCVDDNSTLANIFIELEFEPITSVVKLFKNTERKQFV